MNISYIVKRRCQVAAGITPTHVLVLQYLMIQWRAPTITHYPGGAKGATCHHSKHIMRRMLRISYYFNKFNHLKIYVHEQTYSATNVTDFILFQYVRPIEDICPYHDCEHIGRQYRSKTSMRCNWMHMSM